MRFLVDTNICLDFFLDRGKDAEEADIFFRNCYRLRHEIYVSAMSLRDIGYVCHHVLHDNTKARDIQFKTYSLVSKVFDTSADAAIDALFSDNINYEDMMQINTAMECMADAIITNDKKGFKNSRVRVFTPQIINSYLNKM